MAFDQFLQQDTTSALIEVPLRSKTTGQLLTGVAYGSVTVKYVREGAASETTVTAVTMTQGTHTSGGWIETGIAGVYQFGIPDAALASGAKAVTLTFSASGALDVVKRIVLVVEDLRDVLISSRLAAASYTAPLDAAETRSAVGLSAANLDTQLSSIASNVSTALARLGAWAGSGINNVLGALRAMMRADAATPSDIGGAFDPATDSLEALAAGGAINPQDVADAMALATADTPAAGSVLARLAAIQVVTDSIDASAVTTAPPNNAGHLTIVAALTYRMTASGLVIPADWKRAYFTLKTSTLLPDDAAIVQVLVSNPAAGSDGLLRINKAAPSGGLDNTRATLTINQAAGTATLWIDDDATRLLSDGSMTWDVKFIDANGHSTGARGTANVITTETLTT